MQSMRLSLEIFRGLETSPALQSSEGFQLTTAGGPPLNLVFPRLDTVYGRFQTCSAKEAEPESHGLSTGDKAGIGIGSGFAGIIIFVLIPLYIRHRKKEKERLKAVSEVELMPPSYQAAQQDRASLPEYSPEPPVCRQTSVAPQPNPKVVITSSPVHPSASTEQQKRRKGLQRLPLQTTLSYNDPCDKGSGISQEDGLQVFKEMMMCMMCMMNLDT
ncbi:predicted protein [Aspergillus nidulans FGSC A4]|nr:predicted protein [Aspergillus nidulans FGSC A4]|eukprot:XP_659183.1 predicted protein [Aspergillus nidulans FGSC A4]